MSDRDGQERLEMGRSDHPVHLAEAGDNSLAVNVEPGADWAAEFELDGARLETALSALREMRDGGSRYSNEMMVTVSDVAGRPTLGFRLLDNDSYALVAGVARIDGDVCDRTDLPSTGGAVGVSARSFVETLSGLCLSHGTATVSIDTEAVTISFDPAGSVPEIELETFRLPVGSVSSLEGLRSRLSVNRSGSMLVDRDRFRRVLADLDRYQAVSFRPSDGRHIHFGSTVAKSGTGCGPSDVGALIEAESSGGPVEVKRSLLEQALSFVGTGTLDAQTIRVVFDVGTPVTLWWEDHDGVTLSAHVAPRESSSGGGGRV